MLFISDSSLWSIILLLINIFFSLTIIFLERRNPTATLAWLLVLAVLPYIGFVFYLLLAQNISRQKIFRLNIREYKIQEAAIQEQLDDIATVKQDHPMVVKYLPLIKLNLMGPKARFTDNNMIQIYTDGQAKFASLKDDLKNAQTSINILYYIIKDDALSREIYEILMDKARSGVTVRLLYDALGGRFLSAETIAELKGAGIKVQTFFPSWFKIISFKTNYRNHRKLVIVDESIGYIGGFNIGDEYVSTTKKYGYWRDTHLRIVGDAVIDMYMRFILDWRTTSDETLIIKHSLFEKKPISGNKGVQIIASGPDNPLESIKETYLKMINLATQSIYIQTPYFIPDDSIMEALKIAVLSGIDVNIMIPNKPDHAFVYWATYSYVGELIDLGAKIYTYELGFLHAKTLVVDSEVASVGTANFDIRSFRLNFESNALVFDPETALQLEEAFKNDLNYCQQITPVIYHSRPLRVRIKESISRLLSPIL